MDERCPETRNPQWERWFNRLSDDGRAEERSWFQGANRAELDALGLAVSIKQEWWQAPELRAVGHVNGVPLCVERNYFSDEDGSNPFRATRIEAKLSPFAVGLLQISVEGAGTLAFQELTGIRDLQCGSPDLDSMFLFRSSQPRLATRMLQTATFQDAMRWVMRRPSGMRAICAKRPSLLVEGVSPVGETVDGLVALVRARETVPRAVLAAALQGPGLASVDGSRTVTFSGTFAGASVRACHDPGRDGVRIEARPVGGLPPELVIWARDSPWSSRWRRGPGVVVEARDPVIDSVLELRVAEGATLELNLAREATREALLVVLKGQPRARVFGGAVTVELDTFEPSEVHAAIADAVELAAALGVAGTVSGDPSSA